MTLPIEDYALIGDPGWPNARGANARYARAGEELAGECVVGLRGLELGDPRIIDRCDWKSTSLLHDPTLTLSFRLCQPFRASRQSTQPESKRGQHNQSIFTPVGTAMTMLEAIKKACTAADMPTVYMWCAQTTKPMPPIATMA